MRSFLVVLVALLAAGACIGCGEPTLDASSEDTLNKSSAKISKGLDEAKRQQFEQAFIMLGLDALESSGAYEDQAAMERQLKLTFHGKTADEVIAAAESLRATRQREREELLN